MQSDGDSDHNAISLPNKLVRIVTTTLQVPSSFTGTPSWPQLFLSCLCWPPWEEQHSQLKMQSCKQGSLRILWVCRLDDCCLKLVKEFATFIVTIKAALRQHVFRQILIVDVGMIDPNRLQGRPHCPQDCPQMAPSGPKLADFLKVGGL